MRIVTSSQMSALEAEADASGLTYAEMMRRAGEAVARTLDAELDGAGQVVILAGPGNNGGDGLVAAAELHDSGYEVRVYLWKRTMDGDDLVGELVRRDVEILRAEDDERREALMDWLEACDAVVDALLGTGVARALADDVASILDAVAAVARRPYPPVVVAVDVATGLNPDDGSVDPHTVPADITVTFGLPKLGQYLFPGAEYVGELVHDTIGIHDDDPQGALFVTTPAEIAALLPPRSMSAHKGTFGRVLVVAGSVNYTGAAYLAAAAAYRSGAGLVTTALPGSIHGVVAARLPESTFVVLPEDLGVVGRAGAPLVRTAWAGADAVLLGPGLTTEQPAREFFRALLVGEAGADGAAIGFRGHREGADGARSDTPTAPLVLDADGLNLCAAHPDAVERLPPGSVLTPHPGEMSRLLDVSTADIAADRLGTARRAAESWGQVVVLKGAFTVVAAPDGRTAINPFANAALATGGTGDVLAGLIAGLMAQGVPGFEAALAGCFLHGLAAEHGSQEIGGRALLAGDLVEMVPLALSDLEM